MTSICRSLAGLLAGGILITSSSCGSGGSSSGSGAAPRILVDPAVVYLRDAGSAVSLRVRAPGPSGRIEDVTQSPDTIYSSADPTVATVTPAGVVQASTAAGSTEIQILTTTLSAVVPVYSDLAPPLAEGDFDLIVPDDATRKGAKVSIPLVARAGADGLGSYRVLVTYDDSMFEHLGIAKGQHLGHPLAVRSETPGEIEILGGYRPSLGSAPSGTVDAAVIVFRAIGNPGDATILTGKVLGVSDGSFPAIPLGPAVPRDFATGRRWIAIR